MTHHRVIADGPLADAVIELLDDSLEILPWDTLAGSEAELREVTALYTYGHPTVDDAVLARLPQLKVISNYGVGVDHIDVPAASRRGVPVGNTPRILDGATADMALTLMLAAARRLIEGDRYARSPEFTQYDPGYMLGREVHGQTVGIFGLGRIGLEIARRTRAFGMPVLYHNRNPREAEAAEVDARYVARDELLAESDFIVLSVPLTDATRGFIDAEAFAKMKPTAILVNVARGPVVDTDALTEALKQKRIYAAAVDVTDPEPLPRDHPLLKQPNLTIAPHLGSATEQTRRKMAEISVENLGRGLRGERLLHEVQP